jgi:hypothetical protein
MAFMINVDLETLNVSGGKPNCQSAMHEGLGRHYDLTVHALGCGTRGSRSVHRPPTRYWDDNDGEGYSLPQVIERIAALRVQQPNAYPRRCRSCGIKPHLPDWD